MARTEQLRMVSRRPYWRETDARVVVEQWQSSGASLAAFCRRHKLKPQRVARWARRLSGETLQFHPVELVRDGSRTGELFLELELARGETIRVPSGFSLDDLRRMLVAVDERA